MSKGKMTPDSIYARTTHYTQATYKVPKADLLRLLGIPVPEGAKVRIDGHSDNTVDISVSHTESS
jgi:hypothetical protein